MVDHIMRLPLYTHTTEWVVSGVVLHSILG